MRFPEGAAAPVDFPAHGFTLTDQHGKQVSLASLRGKVILRPRQIEPAAALTLAK